MIDRGRAVASGTPETLKQTVGRDVLEISVSSDADFAAARTLLDGESGLTVDSVSHRLDVPITNGARQSLAVLRRLEDQAVDISDFQLRRPTLDDAFLALTGAPATEREEATR